MVQNTTEISCPSCETVYRIPDSYFASGKKRTRCSVCGHKFVIDRSIARGIKSGQDRIKEQFSQPITKSGINPGGSSFSGGSNSEEAEIFLTGSFIAFDPGEIALSDVEDLFNVASSAQVVNYEEDNIFSTSSVEDLGVDEVSQMSRNEPFGIGQFAFIPAEEEQVSKSDIDFKVPEMAEAEAESSEEADVLHDSFGEEYLEAPPVEVRGIEREKSIEEDSHPIKDEVEAGKKVEEQIMGFKRNGDDQEFELLAAALDETAEEQETGTSFDVGFEKAESEEEDFEPLDFDEGDIVVEPNGTDSQAELSNVTAFDQTDLADVEIGESGEEKRKEPFEEFSFADTTGEFGDLSSAAGQEERKDDDDIEREESASEFSLKEQFEDKYRLELDPFSKSVKQKGEFGIEDTLAKELTKFEAEMDIPVEDPQPVEFGMKSPVESAKGAVVVEETEKTPDSLPKKKKSAHKKPEIRKGRPTIENVIKPETIPIHFYQIGVLVAGLGSYATIIFGKPPWQFDPLWASTLVALGILGFFMQGLSGLLLAGVFSFFYPLSLFSRQMEVIVDGTFSGLFVLGAQLLLSIIFISLYFFTMGRKGDHLLPKPGIGFSLISLLFGLLALIVGSWAHIYTVSIPPLEQVLLMGFSIGNISFYSGVSLPILIQALLISLAIASGFTARAVQNRLLIFAYIGVFFGFFVLLLLYIYLMFGEIRIMIPV